MSSKIERYSSLKLAGKKDPQIDIDLKDNSLCVTALLHMP
jgi:hypothetical protein